MASFVDGSAQPGKAYAQRQRPARIVPAIPFALSRKPQGNTLTTRDEATPSDEGVKPNGETAISVTVHEPSVEATESPGATTLTSDVGEEQLPATTQEAAPSPVEDSGDSERGDLTTTEVADGALTPKGEAAALGDIGIERAQSKDVSTREACEAEQEGGIVNDTPISDASTALSEEPSLGPSRMPPPPFYPSSHRATPSSVTSSSLSQRPPSVPNVPLQNLNPSANGLVFGATADSSNGSPVPPPLATAPLLPYPAPSQAFPSHMYGHPYHFVPVPGQTPIHTPHLSDSRMPVLYGAPFNTTAYGSRGDGPNYAGHVDRSQGWLFQDAQAHHPGAATEQKHSAYPQPHVNGNLREPLLVAGAVEQPASQEAYLGDTSAGLRSGHGPLSGTDHGDADESVDSLTKYLASQFANRHFADYIIQLCHVYNLFPPAPIPVHRLLVARSPTLLALMTSNDSDPRLTPKLLKISVADDFTNIYAFTEALKYLYGLPLLSPSALLSNMPPLNFESAGYGERSGSGTAMDRMGYVLAYVASGFLLQLNQVVTRGIEVAEKLLRWDTLELALAFALDGGLDSLWFREASPHHQENNWMKDVSVQPEQFSAPRFGTYATRLLRGIVSFLILNFPLDFEFDSSSSQLRNVPRLPTVVESWVSSSNPRLSQIRFGEIPVEETPKPNPIHTILSCIFLSMPFPVLRFIFESSDLEQRVGPERFTQLKRKVIEERESRRRKAVKGRTVPSYNRALDESLWRNTLWAEKLESTGEDSSGLRLVRERQEPHTPDSAVSGMS